MPSKLDRVKARLKSVTEGTKRVGRDVLHSGETLVVGSGVAYAEGRMSADDGEWGFRGVPYAYMGGAVLYLTGLFAGDRYSADFFAAGTGAVGAHLFRGLYESGLTAKADKTTGGKGTKRRIPMGLQPGSPPSQAPPRQYNTVFDRQPGASK